MPSGKSYSDRLERELSLIKKFNFENTFIQVREILDLAPEFKHITRGSAGCSLVGFLLGIHDMDPVARNFVLSRFMHENRPDLPDIDLDFAYNQRDEVIERVKRKYYGRVARISNHVNFKTSSSVRQSLREHGYRKFLPKYFDLQEIAGSRYDSIIERAKQIDGTFKNFSLHCGGIVIFPDKIPDEFKLKDDQIILNKDQIEQKGLFKIDLLCNRAMAQFNELSNRDILDYSYQDLSTSKLFQSGNSWGVTFAESPAQRKLHADILPRNRDDIIFSLALIRPLPSADGRRLRVLDQFNAHRNHRGHLVYDDDGIMFIQDLLKCTESEAELYRKAFGKKNQDKILEFAKKIENHPEQDKILKELGYFSLYSFCHAHASSYGNLVWALAFEKTRQPKKFWLAALNHAQSQYNSWVHIQEAKYAGLKFACFGKGPWKLIGDELHPNSPEPFLDGWNQFKHRGYWTSQRFMPGMYLEDDGYKVKFKGLIATGRHHTVDGKEITFVTIGTGWKQYIDLIIPGLHEFDKFDIVSGIGNWSKKNSLAVNSFCFSNIKYETGQRFLFDTHSS